MMNYKVYLTVLFFGFLIQLKAQNVGIGTNTPLSKLHIAGAIRSDTLIGPGVRSLFASPNGRIYDSLVTPSTLNWQINGNSNITALEFLGTTNANDVIFKTNSIERARILSTGNFGINTISPLEKFHVNGNILANDGVYPQSSFNVGYSAATVISDIFQPWTDNGLKIYDGNSLSHLHVEALGHCAIQAYGVLGSPKSALENTAYSVLALQDKGGDVGIGTVFPGNKLEITSASANTSGLRFTNLTSASPTVVANGKGLSVDANGDVVLTPSAADAWALLGNAGTTAGTNFLGTTDAQDFVIKTNNAEYIRVLSTGNVGIRTATPTEAFEIGNFGQFAISAPSGSRDPGDIIFKNGDGTNKARIYSNPSFDKGLLFNGDGSGGTHMLLDSVGRLGIGTVLPNNRLEVVSGIPNTSGLRLTNLTSASPTVVTTGKALSVDANGDVILIPAAANAWELLGNAGTTAGTNFLGTTDAQDMVVKTNNNERMRVMSVNGNVGVGTPSPDPSAKVDIASITSGFAMPRMNSVQRKAITTPVAGLQVYDTDLKGFYVYDGVKWDCANNPAGTVQYFANSVAPNGYLECNGQAVNRTTYAELFSAIGTLYGAGNGVTTFNLPDLRGEFIRGADNARGADPGRALGTTQAPSPVVHDDTAGAAAQNGDFSMDNVAATYSDPWPGTVAGGIPSAYWAASPATWTVYTGTTTGGAAYGMIHGARPRNVALMPCIKF